MTLCSLWLFALFQSDALKADKLLIKQIGLVIEFPWRVVTVGCSVHSPDKCCCLDMFKGLWLRVRGWTQYQCLWLPPVMYTHTIHMEHSYIQVIFYTLFRLLPFSSRDLNSSTLHFVLHLFRFHFPCKQDKKVADKVPVFYSSHQNLIHQFASPSGCCLS